MARLYSKKKGKSGTKRPKPKANPEWVDAEPEEIKALILKMSKEGIPSAKIGMMLRDMYGVPSVRTLIGMTVGQFLKKEGAQPEYPEDLLSLIKKAVRMREHLKASKKDVKNKVKLGHVESKINRLVKYYSKKGRLPGGWKYEPEKAALLVK